MSDASDRKSQLESDRSASRNQDVSHLPRLSSPDSRGDSRSGSRRVRPKVLRWPSHCLPTNTTARFASGISVYEFLKRTSVVKYEREGLMNDAGAIIALADAEQLDAHAASVRVRMR